MNIFNTMGLEMIFVIPMVFAYLLVFAVLAGLAIVVISYCCKNAKKLILQDKRKENE